MTWAEFRIRLFAYKRQQKQRLYELRRVCYQIYVSNWYGKKKPKSIDAFWKIDDDEPQNLERFAGLRKAREEYLKKKNARIKDSNRSRNQES